MGGYGISTLNTRTVGSLDLYFYAPEMDGVVELSSGLFLPVTDPVAVPHWVVLRDISAAPFSAPSQQLVSWGQVIGANLLSNPWPYLMVGDCVSRPFTPAPTATPLPTSTSFPTPSPSPTATPVPSSTPTATAIPQPTFTPPAPSAACEESINHTLTVPVETSLRLFSRGRCQIMSLIGSFTTPGAQAQGLPPYGPFDGTRQVAAPPDVTFIAIGSSSLLISVTACDCDFGIGGQIVW